MRAAHEGMDLRLLGPVRAWRGETELPLGSARRAAVLAVLALHAGHAVSRQQLVGALWGDEPPASAIGNVYTYVSTLRRVLEPDRDRWAAGQLLTSGGGTYCLHVQPENVDVFRFEALRDESRRHRAAGDRLAELAALEAAMRLWHGEALSGVPGPYAESQRLRLTELRLASAERHAALLMELGRNDEAIAALRALVQTYPLQETLHGMLMTALQATGRQAEALRVHDHLSQVLLEETGTEPSAALRTMRLRILTGTKEQPPPSARPAAVVAGPASDPVTLIGRDAELGRLRRAVMAVAGGQGRSIRVVGAPGMGKSALLTVALRGDVPRGCRVGWGLGDELARRMPLGVLLECMESAMSGDAPRELVRHLFTVAADAIDGPRPQTVERAVDLVRQAAESPLILVADDLQRADSTTLEVWAALHELTRELPLLLVASVRPGSPEVLGVPADETVELPPLGADQATALVRAVAPESLEPRLLRRLLADAGGNPYYLRHLATSARNGTGYRDVPPAELVAAVNAHLAAFSEETRHILRACAFLGGDCTIAEVAAVTDRAPHDLARIVEPARVAGVLTEDPHTLAFRHRIVSRVLHESTPAALRIMLHRSFAEKIAELGGAPERVVEQLLAGPVPLDAGASRWLTRHIDQLAARAPEAAVTMLRQVRAEYALDESTRLGLTAWLARLLHDQGQNAVADAGWVAARTTDVNLEAEMQWIMACSHDRQGEHAAAADLARAALSSRHFPEPWLNRFRLLITRLRPHLPGEPTAPHLSRSLLLGDHVSVSR
ncbi:BTAD domain-containing putative transcriptional regulator [Actinoplanes sp. NPDC049548]|uniref:BTAD domain-containing putative transcriptional regulator n=1 Tax=Actinoplanes sp. NPDC049548 TaxID=3155152 RepID=UPI0034140FED